MGQSEIDAALQAAFDQCRHMGYALTEPQQQTLRQTVLQQLGLTDGQDDGANPLDELSTEEQQQLIRYVRTAQAQSQSWKAALLNDWLKGNDSGNVQFIRDRYGPQWLDRVEPHHLAPFLDGSSLPLCVGDRIEVSNGLWEWVQEQGPCQREWVPCQVISLGDRDGSGTPTGEPSGSIVVRFEGGQEYEIQGVYDWNRYQWRRQRSSG
ncbi:MAG: hypothetical protein ACFB4J_19570 [Elainellaceae cyanobacterium]